MRIAIIGAGISGLTVARILKEKHEVTVFEKESQPGGLLKCRKVGNIGLFHTCGGHVFNSKRQDVLEWFWHHFNRDIEFTKANRNSVVFFEGGEIIPYPIENHVYLMQQGLQMQIIGDLLSIGNQQSQPSSSGSFKSFLLSRFGKTLYDLYFNPYNSKIWRRDLDDVPLSWLEGKLPMPTVKEIIYNNMNHVQENQFVHSSFWYAKNGGSQFLVDRLSEGLNIKYNVAIDSIRYDHGAWTVMSDVFDRVVFCGNIKDMVRFVRGIELGKARKDIEDLDYHGTTTVFCEIDKNPYSWLYQPSTKHDSHRIICTGNFAGSNNGLEVLQNRMTATVEFTDEKSQDDILQDLARIPFHPVYIDHVYNQYTYPVQNVGTRSLIRSLKKDLCQYGLYFTGRFADWEYYNMDAAIGAALDLCATITE